MTERYAARRSSIIGWFDEEGHDALLVVDRSDIRYLTGFTGSNGWLLVTRRGSVLVTDARYATQAPEEAQGCRVAIAGGSVAEGLVAEVPADARRIAFDAAGTSHAAALDLAARLPDIDWRPGPSPVARARWRKDAHEVGRIEAALKIAERALTEAVAALRPGMTELDLAADLEHRCRRQGSERMAFDTIVAAGPRGALPHARPGDQKLRRGDVVVVDMGCVVDGYCSDITRCVVLGGAMRRQWQEIHGEVQGCLEAAVAAVAPGVRAAALDAVAREYLGRARLDEYFVHGLGHGVGLEIHEGPRLSNRSAAVLESGMVVTIEPGVYIPGEGGLRLEDMVVVSDSGARRLNALSTGPMYAGDRAE